MDTPPSATRRRILLWAAFATSAAGIAAFLGRARQGMPSSPSVAGGPASETDLAGAEATTLDPAALPAEGHPVYSPLLNTEFTIERPGEPLATCLLVEVSPVRTMRTHKGDFTSFTLLFEAKPGILGEGGICRVGHPELAPMEIFLSPVGRPGGGRILLEAAFTQRA